MTALQTLQTFAKADLTDANLHQVNIVRRAVHQQMGGVAQYAPACPKQNNSAQDYERAGLLALIAELENAPGYQTCDQHWTKAHVAGLLREILGLDVPPCDSRHAFAVYEGEHLKTSSAIQRTIQKGSGSRNGFFQPG